MMLVVLTVTAIFTAVVSAIAGMAGGIALLAVMTFFMPLSVAIPIHGVAQFISNFTRAWALRSDVVKPIFLANCLGLPLGTLVAIQFIRGMDQEKWPMLLIVALIWYVVFKPKKMPEINLPNWGFFFVALLVGALNPIVGATGPLQAVFYLRPDLSKNNVVATKASGQCLGHFLKVAAFLYIGFEFPKYIPEMILMGVGVIVGTKLGLILLHKINEKKFKLIYKGALLLASFRVLYKVL